METLLLTVVLFIVIVAVMAVGVMLSGRSLRGSCGGPSCVCKAEGKDPGSCEFEGKPLPTHQP
ncbi:MAG TPA: hypothetical protein VLT81_08830 [Chondromyces sp.]|nr:hypothetical protein [Chondromyces sp.]